MIVLVRTWILRAAYALFRPLRVRGRVVLASWHTRHLSGNLEAIRDELTREQVPFTVVERTGSSRLAVLVDAVRTLYYLATSAVVLVDDYVFALYVVKLKPGVTVIQTWHASGAFKKIGYSVLGKSFGASEQLVRRVPIHSNYTWVLMGSKMSVPAYSDAFRQPAEKFVTGLGIPRTDVFFDDAHTDAVSRAVRERYGLPADKKIILYAPTFRGTSKFAASFNDALDLAEMKELCADEYVLLVRLHPFVTHDPVDESLSHFAWDVSRHPDINDLLLASDVLITDYSSLIFEYALLERPMVFFAPDLDAYEEERGFYFPYREWVPGPVCTTTAEVAEIVSTGHFDVERVKRFKADSFEVADGRASHHVVRELIMPALRGARPEERQ